MNNKLLLILLVCCILLSFTFNRIIAQPTEKIPVIIRFTDKQDKDLITQSGGDIKTVYHIRPAVAASLPQKAIDNLRRNPKIEYIVEDLQVFTLAESYDWGVDRIDADVVHGYNKGAGVNVAILDTGIDYNHPDLAANYAGGYDWVNNDSDPMDDNGHGTHCAGIVGAVMGNDQGVIGVAPEARLWALKVLDANGSGWYSDIVSALEWCIDTRSDPNPDNDIQVISMSLGSEYSSGNPEIESWINDTYDAGIVLVGAAGNSGNRQGTGDNVIYPARYDKVIAVAATDSSDNRVAIPGWWSSCTGPAVELAAPGLYIYSTYWDDTYATLSGTSMACPMVSGTAALVIATGISDGNGNGRINDEVRTCLQVTADDLGVSGRDTWYGFGLVDANGAALPCGTMGVSPTSWSPLVNPGFSANQTVTISATGGSVNGVTVSNVSGPTWLTFTPSTLGDIAAGTNKTFTITAAPPANTSGDFAYTMRVNNTCGTPTTGNVTGTIHVGMCGDVAPYPNGDGVVDIGDVILLHNHILHLENPKYELSDNWAGDCQCNGEIDIGDVILLHNHILHPENPRYNLNCCE